jgi:cobalamin biosynthesis Mg chelatase CobN
MRYRLFYALFLIYLPCVWASQQEQVELTVKGATVKALYQGADDNKGGIVLIQGDGSYQSEVIDYLKGHFPKKGWSSLQINLPGVDQSVDVIIQLPEAISYLRKKKVRRIIVLFYGKGNRALLDYFAKQKKKRVSGLILLSAFTQDRAPAPSLSKWNIPILDVIGQFDYQNVLTQSNKRMQAFNPKYYRQIIIPGANHSYAHTETVLLSWLRGWMKKQKIEKKTTPPIKFNRR